MIEVFKYEKREWYPHMKPKDVAIWNKFIEQYPDAYDNVQYDLEIGQIPEFVYNHPDAAMQAQAPLYQRKIDVVGFKGSDIDIIEIKPNAGLAALGQVNGYKAIYTRDFIPQVVVRAVIATDKTDQDTKHAADIQGVFIIVTG